MSKKVNNQVGSTVSFIIIAIVLVIITAGTIYFVGQRGDQARRDEQSKITEEQSDEPLTVSSPQPGAITPEPEISVPVASSNNDNLPTTGLELDLIRFMALGLIVWSGTSFVLSKVDLRRSL